MPLLFQTAAAGNQHHCITQRTIGLDGHGSVYISRSLTSIFDNAGFSEYATIQLVFIILAYQ
jgi:hypothetical protein